MRVLVLRGGALGDLILTLPILTALRRDFPQHSLELLGIKPQLNLAEGKPADAVHDLGSLALIPLFARSKEFSADWRRRLSETDVAITYLADPDNIVTEQLRRGGITTVIQGRYRFEQPGLHAVDCLAEPLSTLGISLADRVPRLERSRKPNPELTLALHVGSGSPRKNWPLEKWAECLTHVQVGRIYLVIGEADREVSRRFLQLMPSARIRCLELVPLPELAVELGRCHSFIGHDSGVTHMAAAIGLPTIALFGPTDPSIWRPLGDHVTVVRSPTGRMEDLAVHQVLEALEPWSGCDRY
jgi:heptosyltransferase-3